MGWLKEKTTTGTAINKLHFNLARGSAHRQFGGDKTSLVFYEQQIAEKLAKNRYVSILILQFWNQIQL